MTRLPALALAVALASFVTWAAEPPTSDADATPVARELEPIREQLVALDIEKALGALNAILERPDLPEATRVAALDLRAQAYVASDDLDAAEKDYRAILALSAGYEPGRDVTSKKAMTRFAKIRATMIGTIHLDLDPKDASLTLDGRPVSVPAVAAVPAVAGDRHLSVARKGFDAQDADVRVVAGGETLVKIRLVPNARNLVVRTDVEGVAVALDGVASGITSRGDDVGFEADASASLVIEDVAIGEHEIRLAKPCFATETLQEVIAVDLTDRSPKVTRVVAMRPARTRVTATGATYQGDLRVDGEPVGTLPLTMFEMCPGVRTVEVVASGRDVWSEVLDAEESDLTLDLSPRPSAVLVGAEWPRAWAGAVAAWSQRGRVDPPPGADLTEREAWGAVALPSGTDLAIAVIPRAGIAGDDRIVLYGPTLQQLEKGGVPPPPSRPIWSVATLGVVPVDGGPGSVVIAVVSPAGPAARAGVLPGDRVRAVNGRTVANARSIREAIENSGIGARIELDIESPSGTVRKLECVTSMEPALPSPRDLESSRVVRAAWASVEAAVGGADAPAAFANLAILLERSGRDASALDAWRRVRAIGAGALAARAAYAIGAGLQSAGKDEDAVEAFREAKSYASTQGDTALAAAADDRLADLGVAPR